ncbi:MAG: hypothetical protein AB4041_02470 [Microcystaceae cyanobacterium]
MGKEKFSWGEGSKEGVIGVGELREGEGDKTRLLRGKYEKRTKQE